MVASNKAFRGGRSRLSNFTWLIPGGTGGQIEVVVVDDGEEQEEADDWDPLLANGWYSAAELNVVEPELPEIIRATKCRKNGA